MNRWLPLMIILSVLLLAAGGGVWLYQSSQQSSNQSAAPSESSSASTPGETPPSAASPLPGPTATPGPVERRSVVTLEEFGDYQCPPCGQLHPELTILKKEFGERLRFVYRHFPLIQIHPNAQPAALAAVAASFQGSFWEMHNLLYQNQSTWSGLPDIVPQVTQYARQAGLDVPRFLNDMQSPRAFAVVSADQREGTSRNVTGTPTLLINGEMLPFESYSLDQLRREIDRRLLPR